QKGETVQLGDLGHFQAVIGSKGTKLESDFNASLIKRPRIVFRPSVTLKSVTGLAKFEKIVPDAPAPGGGDSESPDEI
ncbi:DNA-binding protein, partial [Parabacteroides distasonis]